jgi:hypothetical protein
VFGEKGAEPVCMRPVLLSQVEVVIDAGLLDGQLSVQSRVSTGSNVT